MYLKAEPHTALIGCRSTILEAISFEVDPTERAEERESDMVAPTSLVRSGVVRLGCNVSYLGRQIEALAHLPGAGICREECEDVRDESCALGVVIGEIRSSSARRLESWTR